MNVCVLGAWHLGSVTAACLAAAGHDVTGIDFEPGVVAGLNAGTAPVLEPSLNDLLKAGIDSGRLRFTTEAVACGHAAVVWVAYDTPVDDEDRADVDFVASRVEALFPFLPDGALVLVSSQVPVGSTRRLEEAFSAQAGRRRVGFGYSPENLRLGRAIAVFTRPDRVVVGLRRDEDRKVISALLAPFTDRIEWMSVESAEMTKHALNAFLATSVAFINEIAAVCEKVGADAGEVARGLKSEARIGPGAYLSPGGAFAGGTLARDVVFLARLGTDAGIPLRLLPSVKESNDAHREWAQRRLVDLLGSVKDKTVAIWGLTYKPGTDTLRRSSSVELASWLHGQGAVVRAHDPAISSLPADLRGVFTLTDSAADALDGASALVVSTPWPEYSRVDGGEAHRRMRTPLVLDANRTLDATWSEGPDVQYFSVGRARA